MKTLILIPDGVGVRNFLLGPLIHQAIEKGQVHALHIIPQDLLTTYSCGLDGKVQWQPLVPHLDRPLSFILRNALSYAQLCWADTQAMRNARKWPVKGSWRKRASIRVARLIGRAAASTRGMRALDRWHCAVVERSAEVRHYRKVFKEIRPAVIFCSHQRPPGVLPPVLAARSLGIPTATFVFSWDNLSGRRRIAAPFDHYLVWSEHMRQELLRYYPDVAPHRAHIVGTPQFDPYAQEELLWTRAEFFARIGADPARTLICYSGGDVGTCPEDQHHVAILMDLIRAGRIRGNPQVLLRPTPVDEGSRYDQVRRNYPELIFAQPAWVHTKHSDWASVIPLPEDVQFLANLTYHADLNINLGSTMTLDFAIHDKPVVNVAFDVASPPIFGKPLWEHYYQYEHLRPMLEIGATRCARSPEELAGHVNAYIENPTLDRDNRRRFVELEVGVAVGQSSRRIMEVLESIAC